MQTIEQVSKRLSSDPNWFNKCMLGVVFSIIPIAHFVAFGYLCRLFAQGKAQREISLPDWGDWKGMFFDGLKLFLIFFLFGFIPVALMSALVGISPWDSVFVKIPMAPVLFFAVPLPIAALYLYLLNEDFKNCFNFQALVGLMKAGIHAYWVPTIAYIGLLYILPFMYFVGGVIYFYFMGNVFNGLQLRADRG